MGSVSRWSSLVLSIGLEFIFLAIAAFGQTPAPTTVVPSSSNSSHGQQSAGSSQQSPQLPTSNQHPTEAPGAQQSNPQESGVTQEPSANDQSSMFVFKKDVEEVVLHATVTDEERRVVPGLDKSAFTVFENGVPQTITSFRREDVPVAIGIVVDNSSSMRDKRDKISKAVLNLIRSSNSRDEVFVVNFTDNPYLDQDFTSDVNLLQAALHQVSTRGSTALYDAVVASAAHLNTAHLDKKVLLVITDGQDNMSQETLEEAARRLQQANGPILYAFGLLGSGLEASGRDALERLADGTGGVAYFPATLDQVDSLTRSVAHDIRSQYMIAYRPKNQNGKPQYQSLRVEAHAPGYGKLTVRTKEGYYPSQAHHQ
jgi:Ca-activated chloride channel homolog